MSKYYQINDLKVRVSDHEPNFAMDRFRGVNDIELYIKSACNELLSVEGQIETLCEKRGYDISDFQVIIDDWKDGTYNINAFEKVEEEIENDAPCATADLLELHNQSNKEKLKGYSLSKFAKYPEIKALSEKTGVSQSYIKKYFNIR